MSKRIALSSIVIAALACGVRAGQVQLNGRTFTLPDGFTIEQVAGPPLVDRPIVADFDEQGRLYVDDSSGSGEPVQKQLAEKPHRVVRLEDTRGDGRFDKRTVFAEHMMFPEGAMWYAGSLYVGAPPSIWRLTDTKGDGVADQRSEWFQGKTLTGCANDIHGPYLGPDGWIYWCKGAFAEQTYERPGKKPFVTRAAHIFRARPDGSGIEPVMTGGMDNPVHIVFTPGGERLFTTTFLVNPGGGQRDGIIHDVYGGIWGKIHDVIDDHPHTFPEVMPVLVHLGPAAACGLARYESDMFGPEYRDNLFATSFNLHKVTRHILSADGASFSSKNEDFLVCDSLDFHPTDVIEDADGSLLVIDTGGWYKLCCPTSQLGKPDILGAIYRVRRNGARYVEDPRGLKLAWSDIGPGQLVALLDDPRPAVRKRATATLAAKGEAALSAIQQALSSSKSNLVRVNAVWAATRIDNPNARAAVRSALKDADATVRQAAGNSVSLWRDREAVPTLLQLLADAPAPNRRVAAEALGRIGDRSAVAPLLAALEKPVDHFRNHSITYALIELADAKATAAGLSNPSAQVRRAAMMALDQMENGGLAPQAVAAAVTSSDSELRDTAAWIAGRHQEWGDALAAVLRQRTGQPDLSEADQVQLGEQLAKLSGSPAIQDMLAGQAADAGLPVAQRRLALSAMADSGLKDAPQSWVNVIEGVLDSGDAAILPDAISALKKLHVKKVEGNQLGQQLLRAASRTDLASQVRLEALAAVPGGLTSVPEDLFAFLVSQLSQSQPAPQQLLAAQVLEHAKLSDEQLLRLADATRSAGPLEIGPLLEPFSQSSDEQIGRKLVESLKSAKALTSLRGEVIRARLSKFGPEVQKEADALAAKLNPDAAQQKARLNELLAKLPSGDVRRGQLMFNSTKTACSTCHEIGYVGGHVGPDLTRVGAIRSERDLLESIVYPSASFVQSFEPAMVITHSGNNQYGIIRKNDAQEIVLVTGPNQEARVPKSDVKEIRPGTVSIMPAGLGEQLSPQELADLVAFLKACR